MKGSKRVMSGTYLNPDYLAGRATGTCCWACAKRDNCPMEAIGRKCTRDHNACPGCTWWGDRGCFYFEIEGNLLKKFRPDTTGK